MVEMLVEENERNLEDKYVMHTFGRSPVEFVRGEGMHLYDIDGNEYLDFLAGIAVCCLGHSNKALTSAIKEQASELMHVSNYFYIKGRGEAAEKINTLLNFGSEKSADWKMFFANSGAEANECALKIARLRANKKNKNDGSHTKVIVLKNSFHGRTLETLAATAQNRFHEGFSPMSPVFLEVDANDKAQLECLFNDQGENICAMIIEPIQGESGVHPLNESYMLLIRELTEKNDALMICDCVQTGVYRTGTPFAFQQSGVVPDVVTIAKAIGGGFPCGVCAARGEAAQVFSPGDHGSTFGGSNLAIAAINATLDELQRIDVLANVVNAGEYLKLKLEAIDGILEVRGRGLMLGAELDKKFDAHEVVNEALLNQRLVINATSNSTLRFLPPLIVSRADIDEFAEKLQASIEALS